MVDYKMVFRYLPLHVTSLHFCEVVFISKKNGVYEHLLEMLTTGPVILNLLNVSILGLDFWFLFQIY